MGTIVNGLNDASSFFNVGEGLGVVGKLRREAGSMLSFAPRPTSCLPIRSGRAFALGLNLVSVMGPDAMIAWRRVRWVLHNGHAGVWRVV